MSRERQGSTLVIGLGSPLTGDDAVGCAAIARLRDEWSFSPGVEMIEAPACDHEFFNAVESAGAVLIVCALDGGLAPGIISEIEGVQLARVFEALSALNPYDVALGLAIASWRGKLPARAVLLAVQPDTRASGPDLSPRVAARVDVLLFRLTRILESWGHVSWREAPLGVHSHA